jgi:excisionase family DNA binding protein
MKGNSNIERPDVRMFSLKQLNEIFGISVRTWREYIKRKEITAYKVGRAYFVIEPALVKFLKDREAYSWRIKGYYQ